MKTNSETYILLLDNSRVELEIDVLNPLKVDPAQVPRVAWPGPVYQLLCLVENSDDAGFVLETFDVLVAVCVATFQNFHKLFVQTLGNWQETATNLNSQKSRDYKLKLTYYNKHNPSCNTFWTA